jgi:hypothetical protein
MTRYSWNETASGLAHQVRESYFHIERGVVPLRFVDDSVTPPRFVDDAPLVLGVFGNDNYLGDDRTRYEVAIIRTRLADLGAQEMGFSISADGCSWALLVGVDKERYQTQTGKTLQKELLRASLEHALGGAWRKVHGMPADNCLDSPDIEATMGNQTLTA